jgi:hypothetical protein
MGAKELSKYQGILDGGFAGSNAATLAFTDLGCNTLALIARHPNSDFELDGTVVLMNSRLVTDQLFQQRFKGRIHDLNECITDDMEAAGLDLVSLAIAYFCAAVDLGHIDPFHAPLSKAVRISEMEGWSADMISCHVYARYIDRVKIAKSKVVECGSLQQVGTMQ